MAVVSLLTMVSCGRTVQRKLAVESVESVERLGFSGADIRLSVRNDLRRDIVLDSCRVEFCLPAGALLHAELRGGAVAPARSRSTVRLRMKITSVTPAALQVLWRSFAGGAAGEAMLNIDAVVHYGRRERKIYARQVSLSEILSNFGVPENDAPDDIQ